MWKNCINWRSHHGCIKSVAGLYRAGNCQCGRAYRRLDLGIRLCPADYQQGNSYRIIYLHVPAGSGRWAFMHQWRWRLLLALSADENGQPGGGGDGPHWCRVYFIALVTGSAWGKPMWGTWWDGMHA